jgi:hypothetical protein
MKIEFLEEGARDCPLIRIYGVELAEFNLLLREVQEIAAGRIEACSLHALPSFHSVSNCALTMVSASHDEGVSRVDGKQEFTWTLTPQRWSLAAGLIEPFADEARSGAFQWLTGSEALCGLDVGEIAVLLSCSVDGRW